MTTKTDELRELFLKVSPVTTFTDRQQPSSLRGDVPSDTEVEATLRKLVAEMRERFRFRTSLNDEALATVVRGFYAGQTDEELAEALDADADVVTRARLHLHLFRESDSDAPFDLRDLLHLVEEGLDDAACAAELGVSETTVHEYHRVLEARQEAQRDSYHYPLEFESLLGADSDAEFMASLEAERELFAEIKD